MANGEPLSLEECLKIQTRPVFVRKVTRPTPWKDALNNGDVTKVVQDFHEADGDVSLWRVQDDNELRRVAIALNEGRSSPKEKLDLLPILPRELEEVGVEYIQKNGDTSCPPAAVLHYEAKMDAGKCQKLLEMLLKAKRELGRCNESRMKKAAELSEAEQCFAVVEDSTSCACGATRP